MPFAAVQYDIDWEDKPANHRRIDAMLVPGRVDAIRRARGSQ